MLMVRCYLTLIIACWPPRTCWLVSTLTTSFSTIMRIIRGHHTISAQSTHISLHDNLIEAIIMASQWRCIISAVEKPDYCSTRCRLFYVGNQAIYFATRRKIMMSSRPLIMNIVYGNSRFQLHEKISCCRSFELLKHHEAHISTQETVQVQDPNTTARSFGPHSSLASANSKSYSSAWRNHSYRSYDRDRIARCGHPATIASQNAECQSTSRRNRPCGPFHSESYSC